MEKKLLIYGTTMFSAELASIMQGEGLIVSGFVVDKAYKVCCLFQDLPVFAMEDIETSIDMSSTEIVISLGYTNMNALRETKHQYCKSKGYKVHTFISQHALVYTHEIGEGSIILPGSYIGPFSRIGTCSIVRPGTVLAHHDFIGNYNWIADGCTFGGGVHMGDFCFIGLGTTVRNEISIADYTFIAAHSYINKNTELLKPYLGVPARKIEHKSVYDVILNV